VKEFVAINPPEAVFHLK